MGLHFWDCLVTGIGSKGIRIWWGLLVWVNLENIYIIASVTLYLSLVSLLAMLSILNLNYEIITI